MEMQKWQKKVEVEERKVEVLETNWRKREEYIKNLEE